ncbi:hypothetical protein ACFOWZ_37330 [Lentzea rhizosphaerae]|uniref:Uncharacterized protein n=1 Tax=Lentzea rhizosphaerae TaxID=2041025 RepID=A0ABV8C573_9PSEU
MNASQPDLIDVSVAGEPAHAVHDVELPDCQSGGAAGFGHLLSDASGRSHHDQRRDRPTSKNSTTSEPTPSINSSETVRCHAREVCGSWNSLVDIRP